MIVPNACLPALAWLQAAEALEKCELWTRALAQEGDEGRVRSGLELVCRQAWEQLGEVVPVAIRLAEEQEQRRRHRGEPVRSTAAREPLD